VGSLRGGGVIAAQPVAPPADSGQIRLVFRPKWDIVCELTI
jgi:hypothetical protein